MNLRSEVHNAGKKYWLIFLCFFVLFGCDNHSFQEPVYDGTLNVIPITPVYGSSEVLTQIGLPFQFIAVEEVNGQYQNVSENVTWHSSYPEVASIENGLATGVQKGVTSIFAQLDATQSTSIGRISNHIELAVNNAALIKVQVNTDEDDHPVGTLENKLPIGAKQNLDAVAVYDDGTSYDVSNHVEWISDNKTVLSVANASAQMLKIGPSNVYATFLNNKSNALPFIVSDSKLENLDISPANVSVAAQSHRQFTAIATYLDGTAQDVTQHVTWKSGNSSIATINAGEAEAITAGKTTIWASLGAFDSEMSAFTVTNAKLVQLQITPTSPKLNLGESIFYKVKAIYDDGSTDDISSHVLWKSSQPEVSSVVAAFAKANALGQTDIQAHFQGITSNTSELSVSYNPLISLQLTPSVIALAKGTQTELTVMGTFSDGQTQDVTQRVTWQTDALDTAFITHGHVAAISVGNTKIYAVFEGIQSNEASVEVIDSNITALQITPANETVPVQGEVDYQAQATFTSRDGKTTTQDVSHLVAWKSEKTDIATLSHGTAVGVADGATQISAQLDEKPKSTGLTVSDKTMVSLHVLPGTLHLPEGITFQYTAIATYNDDTTDDITDLVNWSTSDSNIATQYAGEVEAVKQGQVTVSANYHGESSNNATLTINAAILESLQLTPANLSLPIGTQDQFQVMARYSNGRVIDVTETAHWIASNPAVITVVKGEVVAITQDTTQLYAALDSISSNRANITVTDKALSRIQVTPAEQTLALGLHQQYTAMAIYSDNSVQDITQQATWSSENSENSDNANKITIIDGYAVPLVNANFYITASWDQTESNAANLAISNKTINKLQLTPTPLKLGKNTSKNIQVQAVYLDGSTEDVTRYVKWKLSDKTLAVIDPKNGTITGIKEGNTTLQALTDLDKALSNIANLEVTSGHITGILVTPTESDLFLHNDKFLEAHALFSDNSLQDVSKLVSWNSSDLTKASVVDGRVTALGVGEVVISIYYDEIHIYNHAVIRVLPNTVESIDITPKDTTFAKGTTLQFTAMAQYPGDVFVDITRDKSTVWSSSSSAVTIDENGLATAITPEVNIIINALKSIDNKAAQTTTIVSDATITALKIKQAAENIKKSITPNSRRQLFAEATFSDNTTQDVTNLVYWDEDSGTTNATVIAGSVYSLLQGAVNITAKYGNTTSAKFELTITQPGNPSCKGHDIVVPFKGGNLTFHCPLDPLDNMPIPDSARTYIADGISGMKGMEVPSIYVFEAIDYCAKNGTRLATIDELLAIPVFANKTHRSPFSIYEQYGWPTGGYFVTNSEVGNGNYWIGGIMGPIWEKLSRNPHTQTHSWVCVSP